MRRTLLLLAIQGGLLAGQAQIPESVFAPPGSEKAWAVAVGISRFQRLPKEQWLDFADADAQSLTRFLTSKQGLSFLPDHVRVLVNEDATTQGIKSALGTWLLKKIKPGDSIYIFVATHGSVELIGERDAYLVTYDSDVQDLYSTAYNFVDVQDLVQRRLGKAARIMLLVDACRAGKMNEAKGFHGRVAAVKGPEVFGLLAAAPDEFSVEGAQFGGGHGAFSYYLLRGLQGDADANSDGLVDFQEAARYVKEQVAKASFEKQNPQQLAAPAKDLVLSLAREERADLGFIAPQQKSLLASLVVSGPENVEVFVNGKSRGVIPHTRQLAVDSLAPDNHKLMLVTPKGARVVQEIQVSADPTTVEFDGKAVWVKAKTRGLTAPAPPPSDPDAQERRLTELANDGQQVILAYLQGNALPLGAEDFERCAALYAEAASLAEAPAPYAARRAFCAGRALVYRRRYAEAEPLLRDAMRLEPRGAYSYNALGIAYLEQNRFDEALREFRAAAERAPRWAFPLFNMALTYERMKQFARAEEAYRQGIQLAPRYAYLHYSLGALYMQLNQPARAEQSLRRALELDLDEAAGRNILGHFYRSRQRDREAETEFRRALAFHSGDLPARLNLARLYRQQGRQRQAENELQEALKKVDAPLIRAALGDLYVEMRRPAEAAAQYRAGAAVAEDAASRAELEKKAEALAKR